MSKRVRKVIGVMLVVLASCFCGLTGCKGKYDDMTLELSTKSIELILDEQEDENGDTKYLGEGEFTASVGGVGSDVSREVFASISSSDVLNVVNLGVDEDGVTKFKLTANSTIKDPVKLTVRTKEGGKTASLDVTATRPLKNISYNNSYSPNAFVVVGQEKIIDSNQAILFEPAETNQKNITYTISQANGHEAKIENGKLLVTKKSSTSSTIVVTASSDQNGIDPVDIELKVVEPVSLENIVVTSQDGTKIDSQYIWSVSNLLTAQTKLKVQVDTLEDIQISASVLFSDQQIFTCSSEVNLANEITLNTLGYTGTNTLRISVKIQGYDYTTTKDIQIKVEKLPSQILVNNEDISKLAYKEYDIYSSYKNNLGQKFDISVGDQFASDKRFMIKLSSRYDDLSVAEKTALLDSVSLVYADNTSVPLDTVIDESKGSIYISAKSTNKEVYLDIVAVGGNIEDKLTATLKLKLSQGVSEIFFGTNENPINTDEVYSLVLDEDANIVKVPFYINKSEYSSKFDISVSKSNIVDLSRTELNYALGAENGEYLEFEIDLVALKEDTAVLTVRSENGIEANLNFRVIKEIYGIALSTDSPTKNPLVADNGNDMYTTTDFNKRTLNHVVISKKTEKLVVELIKFDKNYVSTNAKVELQSMEIVEGQEFISVTMEDQLPYAYITAKRTGTSKVKCTVKSYSLTNEEKVFTTEFYVTVYVPVESLNLNRVLVELIDTTDMLYYQDKMQAQLSASISPSNATLTYTKSDGTIVDYSNFSWSKSNEFVELVDDKNSKITVQGKEITGTSKSTSTLVTVSIVQFGKIFNRNCEIVVKKPELVKSLDTTYLLEKDSSGKTTSQILSPIRVDDQQIDLYIDARKGITGNYSLKTDLIPKYVEFHDVEYITLPNFDEYDDKTYLLSQVLDFTGSNFKINRTGTCYVLAVAKDSVSSVFENGIAKMLYTEVYKQENRENLLDKINEYLKDKRLVYKILSVKIADGSSESLALHVSSLADLMQINSEEGLNKYYVLTDSIDCSSLANFTPIGSYQEKGFSGNFNGNSQNGYSLKNIRFNFNKNQNYKVGLFSNILTNGIVKNLDISIKEFNVQVGDDATASNMYLGGISAINDGTILNCKAEILNSNISVKTNNLYLGAVAGLNNNNSHVENVFASGNLIVYRSSGVETAVGGIVGKNLGEISGTLSLNNEVNNASVFNGENFNSSVKMLVQDSSSYTSNTLYGYGGVAGINEGKISKVSSNATLKTNYSKNESGLVDYMPSNLGGIVGVNKGKDVVETNGVKTFTAIVEQVLSNSKVHGKQNIGGIIGYAENTNVEYAYFLMLENYDASDITHSNDYEILKGFNNIGGIAGYATNSQLTFAMVRSYVSRTISNIEGFNGDIILESSDTNNVNVGGLAGTINNTTIQKSFAYMTINASNNANVGGLVGYSENNSQISISYSRGVISGGQNVGALYGTGLATLENVYTDIKSQQNETISEINNNGLNNITISNGKTVLGKGSIEGSSNWILGSEDNNFKDFNDNLPMISNNNKPFIIQEPKTLTLTFKNSDKNHQNILDENNNAKSAILFLNKDSAKNSIALSDLLLKTVTPANSGDFARYVVDNSKVIRIDGNNLIVVGTGEATLTCISTLNNKAKDAVKIYVTNAISELTISTMEIGNSNVESLNILKNSSQQIFFKTDSAGTVLYDIDTKEAIGEITINGNNANSWSFDSNQQLLITALQAGKVELVFKPYILVGDNKVYLELKDKDCNNITKTLVVNVVNGITSMSLEFTDATISQKDIFNMKVDVASDTDTTLSVSNNENEIKIYEKSVDNGTEDLKVAKDVKAEAIIDNNDNRKYTLIVKDNNENVVDTAIFNIEISTLDNNGNFNVSIDIEKAPLKYQIELPLMFISKIVGQEDSSIEGQSMSKEFTLTIVPQPVYFISTDFYSYAELDADGNVNVNEVPTEKILAGTRGLMKLDLYPDFANIERVELLYSGFDYTIAMEQVVKTDEGYRVLSISTPLITNGIAFDTAYNNLCSKSDNTFDGYLYVYMIIPSISRAGSTITFTVRVISSDGTVIESQKTLTIDLPNDLNLTLDSKNETYIANGVTYEIQVRTTKLMENASDDSNLEFEIYDGINTNSIPLGEENGLTIGATKFTLTKGTTSSLQNGLEFISRFNLTITGELGSTWTIRAGYKKLVGNQFQTYKTSDKNSLKIYVVKYTVDGYTVDGVVNGVFEKSTGAEYPLKIKLKTTYDPSLDKKGNEQKLKDLNQEIENLETKISSRLNTWYALAQSSSLTYSYQPVKISSSSTEKSVYDYFMFLADKDENKNITSIKIAPTRESTSETLQSAVAIVYNAGKADLGETDESKNLLAYANGEMDFENKKIYYKDRCQLNFIYNNTSDKPNPIATYEQFKAMNNMKNYRLLNDIVINEPFSPLDVEIAGLDGNGFTIYINNGFDLTSQLDNSTINVGLFSQVSETTILKNLKICIKNTPNIDLTQINQSSSGEDSRTIDATTIHFGFVAGVNNGIVYNCEVVDFDEKAKEGENETRSESISITSNILSSSGSQVETFIGGIVGVNNNSVTHSRNYASLVANRGYIGGIVAENNGAVASCFYKSSVSEGVAIQNQATTETGNLLAGLVARNSANGTIKLSYVEGSTQDAQTGRYTGGSISANSSSAGLVNVNEGLIDRCYSNIEVYSQTHSAGFVFRNQGTVSNCYSASTVGENNIAFSVFTGTDSKGNINNTNGTITNCYYLQTENMLAGIGEKAKSFSDAKTELNFDFCDDSNENATWNFIKYTFESTESKNPSYEIKAKGFGWSEIKVTPTTNILPTLVDANIIAIPHVAIDEIKNADDPTKDNEYIWNEDYKGSMFNPIVISSAEEFNEQLVFIEDSKILSNFDRYVRIIHDLEFSSSLIPTTTDKTFQGYLCGNGFTISGLNLSANASANESTTVKEYGLFARIDGSESKGNKKATYSDTGYQQVDNDQLATVKNLTLKVEYLTANQAQSVGVLAGTINSGKITDITVDGIDVVIQGKNFVGGLAGQIAGQSKVKLISSNVSINAGSSQVSEYGYLYSSDDVDIKYGYAGAIAGVVDLSDMGYIENITVPSGVYLIANHAGLAFGYVGQTTYVNKVKVFVDGEQFIRATTTAGGVVAENRGTLENVQITYSSGVSSNDRMFTGSPKVIGGLVGLNYGGTIIGAYSKIDVTNSVSTIAGGLVGTTVGGNLSYSYSTGKVQALHVTGGFIGSSIMEKNLVADSNSVGDTKVDNRIYYISNYLFTTVEEDNNIYTYLDSTQRPVLNETISFFNPSSLNDRLGKYIGVVASSHSTDYLSGSNNYYIYTSDNNDLGYGGHSDTTNGTITPDASRDELTALTNKIKYGTNSSHNLTARDISRASSYYKKIFENGWSKYYNVDAISSNNPYPELLF